MNSKQPEMRSTNPNTSLRRVRFRNWRASLLGSAICVSAVASIAASSPTVRTSANIPVEQLKFYQTKEGLTFAKAWGDPAAGPHSNFIRLPGSYASPLHVHSSDYYGVVVTGVVANECQAKPDRPLRPGSYWFQRGNDPHTTKCLSREPCLIFVTSHGAFDLRVVSAPSTLGRDPAHHP
jgi:hypothetical protein